MSTVEVKAQVTQALDELNDAELQQVAEYIAFLKFRARHVLPQAIDTKQLAALYTEFADEDQQLAEEAIRGYHNSLRAEDNV